MTTDPQSSAKNVMGIVRELMELEKQVPDTIGEGCPELKRYASELVRHFPVIAQSLEECEAALEKISKPDIREIKPREDGGYSVMTVEYASWEREIAKQALIRLHSPIK